MAIRDYLHTLMPLFTGLFQSTRQGPQPQPTTPPMTQAPLRPPRGQELMLQQSNLFGMVPMRYNPDDLVGKRGIMIYDKMMTDEQVKTAVSIVQFAVLSPGFSIEPAEMPEYAAVKTPQSRKDDAEEHARFIDFNISEMKGAYVDKMMDILTAKQMGFSVTEILYDLIDAGEFEGKIKVADLKTRHPWGLDFDVDKYGNLLAIRQNNIPINQLWKFMIYSYQSNWGNPYGTSDLRSAYRCYSDDTEVLTEDGWKNISSVTLEDKVATLNPETEHLEYQYPDGLFSNFYQGKMYHQGGKSIDLLVTPNHNLWLGKYKKGSKFRFVEAQSAYRKQRYKRDAKWVGEEPANFVIPEFETRYQVGNKFGHNYGEARYYRGPKTIDIEKWLRFFGVWLAEGWTSRKKNTGQRSVGLAQKPGPKLNAIKEWITDCGFKFSEKPSGTVVQLEIFDAQLFTYLRQFGGSHTKFIPKEIKRLSPRLLRILYQAMVLGDGSRSGKSDVYFSMSKRLADDVSEILLKAGYAPYTRWQTQETPRFGGDGIWRVARNVSSINGTLVNEHVDNREWLDYSGTVYCLEVPNHILYVRRNGKSCWSGNCWFVKDCVIKFMTMALERHGTPLAKWSVDINTVLTNEQRTEMQDFIDHLTTRTGVIIPPGVKLEFDQAAPRTNDVFVPVLKYLDERILVSQLVPGLIGMGGMQQGGSLARSGTEFETFLWVVQMIRQDMEELQNEGWIKPLIDMNYTVDDGLYPKFKFNPLTETKKQSIFDQWIKAITGKALTQTWTDENKARELIGFDPIDEKEWDDAHNPANDAFGNPLPKPPPVISMPGAGNALPGQPGAPGTQPKKGPFGRPLPPGATPGTQAGTQKTPPAPQNKPPPKAPPPKGPNAVVKKQEQDYDATQQDLHIPGPIGKKRQKVVPAYAVDKALQSHLVDSNAQRKLEGADATSIKDFLPDAQVTDYLAVPGIDQMHAKMNMQPDMTTDPQQYEQARAAMFSGQPVETLPISSLTFTQPKVNMQRAANLMDHTEQFAVPVEVLQHAGANYLMNGHHRVAAMTSTGRDSTKAFVFKAKSDGTQQSFDATAPDLREQIKAYVETCSVDGGMLKGYYDEESKRVFVSVEREEELT